MVKNQRLAGGYQNLQRTQVGFSQLRRRERQADDPSLQKKAAQYAADAAALHPAIPAEQAVPFLLDKLQLRKPLLLKKLFQLLDKLQL